MRPSSSAVTAGSIPGGPAAVLSPGTGGGGGLPARWDLALKKGPAGHPTARDTALVRVKGPEC